MVATLHALAVLAADPDSMVTRTEVDVEMADPDGNEFRVRG